MVRAFITGHLVLPLLTNRATAIVTRLVDMGITRRRIAACMPSDAPTAHRENGLDAVTANLRKHMEFIPAWRYGAQHHESQHAAAAANAIIPAWRPYCRRR